MSVLWLALAALVGGLLSGLLGFLSSNAQFDVRKALATVIRAVVGAVLIGWTMKGANSADLLAAFLAGGGADVIGKRGQDALTAAVERQWKKPPSPPEGGATP